MTVVTICAVSAGRQHFRDAEQRQVVRFRTAARKDDGASRCVQRAGHALASRVEYRAGAPAFGVRETAALKRGVFAHGIDRGAHAGIDRRGCGVVQIDARDVVRIHSTFSV